MQRPLNSGLACAILLLLLACGENSGSSPAGTLSGESFCERASSLAGLIGCTTPLTRCVEPSGPQCVTLGNAWLDCVAGDRRQCLCESDGDLNCEGSYKANEGPALCVEEHAQFDACTDGG